ncbi:MAG: hypothetical protein R3C17_16100 [Planctomycetaceae bacterium]
MFRASLLVINGANRGTRYEIASDGTQSSGEASGADCDWTTAKSSASMPESPAAGRTSYCRIWGVPTALVSTVTCVAAENSVQW